MTPVVSGGGDSKCVVLKNRSHSYTMTHELATEAVKCNKTSEGDDDD